MGSEGSAMDHGHGEGFGTLRRRLRGFSFLSCTSGDTAMSSSPPREDTKLLSIKQEKEDHECGKQQDLESNVVGGIHTPRKLGGWRTMPFIFANELCEKLAVVGFSTNMVTYLTQELHLPLVKAANTLTNFGGTASLTPLLGAFLADAYIGRFWTIIIGSIIYQLGMVLLTVSAIVPWMRPPPCVHVNGKEQCQEATGWQLGVFYLSLLLTALGSGGIRPCVVTFGADQFDGKDPEQKKNMWNFFNWYYFCMGLAILTAVTVIVYIQENLGWGIGLGIPTAAMAISIVIFLVGMPLYLHFRAEGSPMTRLVQVIVASIHKRKMDKPVDASSLHRDMKKDLASSPTGVLSHTNQLRFLDKAAIVTEEDTTTPSPWRLCTVHQVEELKTIIRMAPIWSAGILLITASAQQNTFSLMQARTLDRHVTKKFQIPPGSMSVFTYLSLLFWITTYDRVLMPIARRYTGLDRGITFLQRMGIGFFISVLATLVAGFVESKRRHVAKVHGFLDEPKMEIPMSVWWIIPQYALHGMAEAFMSIGHLEFFYDQSPESMRSTATALFWTSISAGNYLSSFLVSVVHHVTKPHDWLADNINRGKLHYFYWVITGLQVVNLFYYCMCARYYTYKPFVVAGEGENDEGFGGNGKMTNEEVKGSHIAVDTSTNVVDASTASECPRSVVELSSENRH